VNAAAGATLPTGRAYLSSLRDGRDVTIDGERIGDVSEHPALRNAARSIARLYDALHEPAYAGELLADGPGGVRTHAFFRVAQDAGGLDASRRAIGAWAGLTYGWMGRTPDYKAALTTTLGARAGWFGERAWAARAWHERAARELPFIAHAVVNPPIDRHLPVEAGGGEGGVAVRVVGESSAGIVVRGAKVVATSAAISEWVFVGQTPATAGEDPSMAVMFLTPLSAPGVRVVCRASYERAACRHGGVMDYPLASRFDENDGMLVLEDVVVPWENVLVYRDPARCRGFFEQTGFVNNFLLHGCVRMGVKMRFMAGLLARALEATGGDEHRGNRALLGEVIGLAHAMEALADAMVLRPDDWAGAESGGVLPARSAALAYATMAPGAWARVREIAMTAVGSGLIYLPSSAADLADERTDALLAEYCRGSRGMGHRERIKVMKLLWDAVGSEFAGRHDLYERNYAGSVEGVRLMTWSDAARGGKLAEMRGLVERCMGEYDQTGFRARAWR
jgi:4-hydroxyphenylacetate 3-monooxygenase